MFYNNYTWSIPFKSCESLYCTPVTYLMLHGNYTSIKDEINPIKNSEILPPNH